MNWLTSLPPGFKTMFSRRDAPDNLWVKCPTSGELVYRQDLEQNQYVTPSGAHMRIAPEARCAALFDGGEWAEIALPEVEKDPLKFKDDKKYIDRLKAGRAKTGMADCISLASGRIGNRPAVVFVQNFDFMGGSLGMAAGEAFIRGVETALAESACLIAITSSGGARMQEGCLSLMQMPRTVLAVQDLKDAGLPYIIILANPTSGGVLASYAMLGDIHIAEPGALIAFTGPRVIEQTIREKLPTGFQRAEFLLEHGMVDMVVDRRQLAERLSLILGLLMPADARQ